MDGSPSAASISVHAKRSNVAEPLGRASVPRARPKALCVAPYSALSRLVPTMAPTTVPTTSKPTVCGVIRMGLCSGLWALGLKLDGALVGPGEALDDDFLADPVRPRCRRPGGRGSRCTARMSPERKPTLSRLSPSTRTNQSGRASKRSVSESKSWRASGLGLVAGEDGVPGRDGGEFVRVEDRGALAQEPDPAVDGGQEPDPAFSLERVEKSVDAGLVADAECGSQLKAGRRHAEALGVGADGVECVALAPAERDCFHFFVNPA